QRPQDRDARAAGADAALGELAGELALGSRQVPAGGERLGDPEAHVVRAVGVPRPGVAEADDQPVDRCGAEELQLSLESAFCPASSAVSPPAWASAVAESTASSPTTAVSVSISSSTGSTVGGMIVAITVSAASSSVTPSGTVTASS